MATKTNPAYAHLAYRKTIVAELKSHLREKYMALSSPEPDEVLLCDDVFQQDSNVPVEEVQAVVEELEQEEESLRLKMGQFSFGKQEESNGILNSAKSKSSKPQGNQGPRPGKRKNQ